MQRKLMMATIAEIIGADMYTRPHWITVRAHELARGDVTRTAAWARTITRIVHRDGRVHIGYEDGSTSRVRSGAYMTIDKDSR
jgi:hypothetical protein